MASTSTPNKFVMLAALITSAQRTKLPDIPGPTLDAKLVAGNRYIIQSPNSLHALYINNGELAWTLCNFRDFYFPDRRIIWTVIENKNEDFKGSSAEVLVCTSGTTTTC
ncbi:hypothetical protein HDV63DRAFT_383648 [Trichoderma sp. SZMC 28014]